VSIGEECSRNHLVTSALNDCRWWRRQTQRKPRKQRHQRYEL